MSKPKTITEIFEKLLEEEMMLALENHDWNKYDIAISKYASFKGERLRMEMTKPYIPKEENITMEDKYSAKARRTKDNGGIF